MGISYPQLNKCTNVGYLVVEQMFDSFLVIKIILNQIPTRFLNQILTRFSNQILTKFATRFKPDLTVYDYTNGELLSTQQPAQIQQEPRDLPPKDPQP